MTDREAAWFAVHDALARLPGWRVTKAKLHEDEDRWHVTGIDPRSHERRAYSERMKRIPRRFLFCIWSEAAMSRRGSHSHAVWSNEATRFGSSRRVRCATGSFAPA